MTLRHSHLDDDLLIGIGLTGGRTSDALALEHLTQCSECDARLRALVRDLDVDRRDAAAEVTAVFTPTRLAAQRARIMRRLDGIGRVARVLEFPDRASHANDRRHVPATTRWVAAAAVIGLVAGLGAGVLVDWRQVEHRSIEARFVAPPTPANDDDLLGDIDQALGDVSTPELSALDAMTPAIHEVVLTSR